MSLNACVLKKDVKVVIKMEYSSNTSDYSVSKSYSSSTRTPCGRGCNPCVGCNQ